MEEKAEFFRVLDFNFNRYLAVFWQKVFTDSDFESKGKKVLKMSIGNSINYN
jgi:hypothetical protein